MTTHERVQRAPVADASGRRDFLRKAGVAGAAAWVAPVVLSTPAVAQGTPVPCTPTVLDWDSFPTNTLFTSTVLNGVTVSLTLSPLPGTVVQASNGRVVAGPSGGIAGRALFIGQESESQGVGQTVTFTFSQPVSNLEFTVTDIDNQSNAWFDYVEILTAGYTYAFAAPTLVTGTGGPGPNRFRNTTNANLVNTDARGNVTLTWAGPVTSVQLRYTNGPQWGNGASQLIRITDLLFDVCP